MRMYKEFDWEEYEVVIKKILYTKAKNHSDNEVTFSLTELDHNLHIKPERLSLFFSWMKRERIVTSISNDGHNRFKCHICEEFFNSELNKELFDNTED